MSYGHYPQQRYPQHGGGGYGNMYHQPQQHHHDPYRAWYAARLAELTFNSRPIIQNLSMEAMRQRDESNWPAMQAITEEIEAAVLRAPPQGKLPLLYLIDSISKNVGPPYTDQLLPAFLAKLFLKTYREVDGVTKSKMEEMVKLWRTGGPYGSELYPTAVREEVERAIIGPPPVLTQPQVQATLRQFLKEKEAEMADEFTTQRAKTVNVLVQIDQLLSSSQVSPKELADIAEKVRAMKAGHEPKSAQLRLHAAPPGAAAPPAAVPPRTGFPNQRPAFPPQQPQQQQYPAPGGSSPYPPFGAQGYSSPRPPAPALPVAAPAAPLAAPAAVPAAPAIPFNVADILRNLNNSGVLSQPRTPEPSKPKSGLENYEDMILALDVRVDYLDPNRLALPVAHLPVRCKQCGMRFADGEAKFQAHMDWHFRRNRKERETEGRGAHRRWLPRAEEWINENVEGSGPSTSPKKTDTSLPTKLPAERLAALKRKWVRAPSDPVKAKIPCPVCKEQFKSEWNEDEEEWVFMNAIEVGSQIYHAVCRAETTLAARLLAKDRAGSRSPAPGADDSAKRKASVEPEAADAAKRVKLSAEPEVKAEPGVEETQVKTEPQAETAEAAEPAADTSASVSAAPTDTTEQTEAQSAPAPAAAPAPAPIKFDPGALSQLIASALVPPPAPAVKSEPQTEGE